MVDAVILIVEDNPLNLELASDILEGAGYAVISAALAREGLRLAKDEQPDLVLMDIRLPDLDGMQAVRLLKDDPATRAIPVIALTAQAMRGDEETARAAGFDGYISKPINTRTFAKTVAAYLPKQPGRRAAGEGA
jgi:two-component system cell cycle response regulator DivK